MECSDCGKNFEIGEWPFCPHGFPMGMGPEFRSYVDEDNFDRPIEITSWAQKKKLERIYGLIERDRPRNGDISARIDECMERRKARARYAMDKATGKISA